MCGMRTRALNAPPEARYGPAPSMSSQQPRLPYYTSDVPGIGGRLRATLDDFQVEEIPAYMPCGQGDHVYLWIEKRQMTTAVLVASIAKALDIRESDIGVAGMKDKFAVTRQMLSLPPPITPEKALALRVEGALIHSATRHGNKLKTGHLRGNRFLLRVREMDVDPTEALTRCNSILAALAQSPGAPNWYGAQRFGRDEQNARIGKELVTKTIPIGSRSPRGRQRRLYISAYQSQLFNDFLAERMNDDLYAKVIEGDVLQKRDSGGMFVSEDVVAEQSRLDRNELAISGPMFGHHMKQAAAETVASKRELALLEREGIDLQSFSHLGKLANGTRRALSVLLEGAEAMAGDDWLDLRFSLPSGSYATSIMREVIKGEKEFPE